MNTKQTEALKLALEALEKIGLRDWVERKEKAITAIREALAEHPAQQDQGQSCYCPNCEALSKELAALKAQQQEPVAYASDVEFDDETEIIPAEQKGKLGTAGLRIPLYIEPPASKPWVGLTDEEEQGLYQEWNGWRKLIRLVEAKLREKNA